MERSDSNRRGSAGSGGGRREGHDAAQVWRRRRLRRCAAARRSLGGAAVSADGTRRRGYGAGAARPRAGGRTSRCGRTARGATWRAPSGVVSGTPSPHRPRPGSVTAAYFTADVADAATSGPDAACWLRRHAADGLIRWTCPGAPGRPEARRAPGVGDRAGHDRPRACAVEQQLLAVAITSRSRCRSAFTAWHGLRGVIHVAGGSTTANWSPCATDRHG